MFTESELGGCGLGGRRLLEPALTVDDAFLAQLAHTAILSAGAKAETVSPYAADYGTRDLESELKALAKDEAASA